MRKHNDLHLEISIMKENFSLLKTETSGKKVRIE